MASVCRTLPDFDASSDEINQFGTLKEQLVHRFVSGGQDDTKREDPELRIRELWGAGGPVLSSGMGALVVFAHKRLSLANILVDQMGSMWLFEVITIHESLFALV